MRVIAGIYKGRRLEAPKGRDVRPTTDKTKEAIFSMLAGSIPDALVLDLFSGTGALGIEALSRGSRACVFCEKAREALDQIAANLDHCGIPAGRLSDDPDMTDGGIAVICPGDVKRSMERFSGEDPSEGLRFDVILMDPPYGKDLCRKTLDLIDEYDLLADDGIIMCEHRKEEAMPERVGSFALTRQRRYGISMVSLYEEAEEGDEE